MLCKRDHYRMYRCQPVMERLRQGRQNPAAASQQPAKNVWQSGQKTGLRRDTRIATAAKQRLHCRRAGCRQYTGNIIYVRTRDKPAHSPNCLQKQFYRVSTQNYRIVLPQYRIFTRNYHNIALL